MWDPFHHGPRSFLQERRLYKSAPQSNTRSYSQPSKDQLTGASLHEKTASITDEARVDIADRGFWISDQ